MGLELIQKQLLKLNLTPQLLQSVTVLQLNQEQLADFIRQKAMENPLLKVKEPDFIPAAFSDSQARSTTEVIEETVAGIDDLRERLHRELHQEAASSLIRDGADFLIDSLNENGYLDGDPAELLARLGLTQEQSEQAMKQVQMLDPAGVGARTVTECLLLQLRRIRPPHPLAERIVAEFTDYFLTGEWKQLAARLGCPEAKINKEVAFIRGLNPQPAAGMQAEKTEYIIPDVTIRQTSSGLSFTLEDRYLPAVALDAAGYDQYLQAADQETRRYLQEKKEEADGLLAGISRRKQTLVRLSKVILQRQQAYFLSGRLEKLVPLTMKQTAQLLGMHESTVSRAAAHKNVETPYGIFPLKKFFVRPLSTDNTATSAYSIQERIQKLVRDEDPLHPLSDQQLAELLNREGRHCARRTIAKYRKILGIGSTVQRRKSARE